MSSIVAIVGRPNVGKSTLFNRLTESRKAIVDAEAGVTRDRHYGKVEWNGQSFTLIDTGGYVLNSDDVFESGIRSQVQAALDEADLILFVVDVIDGLTGFDKEVAEYLRRSKKEVMLVANKVDNNKRIQDAAEFYALGLGDYHCVSSINGSGTGDLLDALLKKLKPKEYVEAELPKLAIVGQPNVGKSSLLNALLGEDRTLVTPIAGTTRDTIHTRYNSFGFDFYLIDTAGLRRKNKVNEDLEFYSVMRTIRAIEDCDVCILMIDATNGFTAQDLNIFHLAERNHKGVVLLINKWDLVEKDTHSVKKFSDEIKAKLEPFSDVPILFTSVVQKQRIHKALELAIEVYKNRAQKIPTSKLNNIILPFIEKNMPPATKGKVISIKYITQIQGYYPQFAFFCNLPQYIKEPYKRYLENRLREHFNLSGVPIEIYFRKKS
ncbi:MAG TPA: ribosome biogenesis GTPase Der [Bacteroidia bacterium]|nr:ribosome biogenesis GTPase Der [Bacteroidia bacterium]HNT80668.1 ribosome biogenesis GTPase Der [Bacteroidia bacterium]